MLGLNPVMRGVQPRLEIAEHAMDVRKASSGLAGLTDDADVMCVLFQG